MLAVREVLWALVVGTAAGTVGGAARSTVGGAAAACVPVRGAVVCRLGVARRGRGRGEQLACVACECRGVTRPPVSQPPATNTDSNTAGNNTSAYTCTPTCTPTSAADLEAYANGPSPVCVHSRLGAARGCRDSSVRATWAACKLGGEVVSATANTSSAMPPYACIWPGWGLHGTHWQRLARGVGGAARDSAVGGFRECCSLGCAESFRGCCSLLTRSSRRCCSLGCSLGFRGCCSLRTRSSRRCCSCWLGTALRRCCFGPFLLALLGWWLLAPPG